MSNLETRSNNNLYLSIVQGSLRQAVPEGTPNAVRREWEAGGKKGVKWEIEYNAIVGKIVNVDFYQGEKDGKKFTNLNLTLDEVEGKYPVISVGVKTRYASDLMKKLPKVDFMEEVRIRPYSFQPEGEDKNVTGVEITQRDNTGNFNKKVSNFFVKKEGDKWVATNGFPEPDEETRQSGEWEDYYRQVAKFLMGYTKQNITTKFNETKMPKSYEAEHKNDSTDYPEEEINPDDIPF